MGIAGKPRAEASRSSCLQALPAHRPAQPAVHHGAVLCGDFSAEDRTGANLHFGVREHAMAAICNGIYLHGGLRPYCATFFVFSDYMKNAMRLSALMVGAFVVQIMVFDGQYAVTPILLMVPLVLIARARREHNADLLRLVRRRG